MLVRAPLRMTLRVWEYGLSTAAEAARIGRDLLEPDREVPEPDREVPDPRNPWREESGAARVEPATAAEPEVVVPETGYLAPEPGEAGPEPDVLDVDDGVRLEPDPEREVAVPDELIPDHVDEEPVLVAETAEEGAEDGAGPELTVAPPWDAYDEMTAADIRDRLSAASTAEAGAVELYERTHKNRSSVIDASERAQRR